MYILIYNFSNLKEFFEFTVEYGIVLRIPTAMFPDHNMHGGVNSDPGHRVVATPMRMVAPPCMRL